LFSAFENTLLVFFEAVQFALAKGKSLMHAGVFSSFTPNVPMAK
jgi:hypothetical protein